MKTHKSLACLDKPKDSTFRERFIDEYVNTYRPYPSKEVDGKENTKYTNLTNPFTKVVALLLTIVLFLPTEAQTQIAWIILMLAYAYLVGFTINFFLCYSVEDEESKFYISICGIWLSLPIFILTLEEAKNMIDSIIVIFTTYPLA